MRIARFVHPGSARAEAGVAWGTVEGPPGASSHVVTRVNGEVKQDGRTSQMIYSVAVQLAFASAIKTLLPGDVLLSGTPAGVGPIVAGDTVSVEIDGIGVLSNPVVDERRVGSER